MLKTKINLKAELPYSIELSNNGNIVYGAGKTPATATMAALSVAKMIPSGLRDNMEAARIIFWNYQASHSWTRLIHILTNDTFEEERKMAKRDWVSNPRVEELEEENIELKETIKNLRIECDEYQKKLDNIDFRAMNIQDLTKQIREMV